MPSCNTYHLTWVSLNLGRGVSLHGCSSKAQPLLLTLDEGYLLTTAPPDLEHGVAPLGPLKHYKCLAFGVLVSYIIKVPRARMGNAGICNNSGPM